MGKNEAAKLGLVQAAAVTGYCALVGLLFWKGNVVFGKVNPYLGPVMFLVLFIVSALICAAAVFYRPYQMFFAGQKKMAADVVLYTIAWLVVFFAGLMLTAVVTGWQ